MNDTAYEFGNFGKDSIPYPTGSNGIELFKEAPFVLLTSHETPFYWTANVSSTEKMVDLTTKGIEYRVATWMPNNTNNFVGHIYILAIGRWKS